MAEYINVTTLNLLAKQVLEQCEPLNNLIVCGEVSIGKRFPFVWVIRLFRFHFLPV